MDGCTSLSMTWLVREEDALKMSSIQAILWLESLVVLNGRALHDPLLRASFPPKLFNDGDMMCCITPAHPNSFPRSAAHPHLTCFAALSSVLNLHVPRPVPQTQAPSH